MQGGPLSPLLANVLLDDLDKELEKRGLRFVRYADDFLVFTKSEAASKRVYESIGNYLTRKLKLVVNHQKSRTCSTDGVEFLGFIFRGYGGQIRVSPKKLKKFKDRIRGDIGASGTPANQRRGHPQTTFASEHRGGTSGTPANIASGHRGGHRGHPGRTSGTPANHVRAFQSCVCPWLRRSPGCVARRRLCNRRW
jgi:hypothetical protein